jgi:hypoxanthine phosphoribosyltransferase
MTAPPYEDLLDYILIDAERLQTRITELGKQITADYRQDHDVFLVGILKGSVLFMADLMRRLDIPHTVDFMDVTSYGAGARSSSGYVRILMDLHTSIEKKHVLIVEDIIDSGYTLDRVLKQLMARRPASLRVCTLLDKAERREVAIPLDYVGFTIPNVFVFGYGLDIDEYYRNLPFIGVVKPGAIIDETG